MKESQLLGTLFPSLPDFLPIELATREKYGLPELSPDDDPITEVVGHAWSVTYKIPPTLAKVPNYE